MWLVDGKRLSDVWRSSNGADWTAVEQVSPPPPRYAHCLLTFQDKMWIVGGYGGGGPVNEVWSSEDGSTWTQVTAQAPWSRRDQLGCLVKDGFIWVIDGDRKADVWRSSNGADWTEIPQIQGFTPSLSEQSVLWKGRIWNLAGYGLSGKPIADVSYSADGISWTTMENVSWSARNFFVGLVYDDAIWVIDGTREGEVWKLQ
jgi:leucine-zipper-like transcriptional regulator 1